MRNIRAGVTALVLGLLITISTPLATSQAAVETLVQDNFNRTVGTGWGIAHKGGTWIQDTTALSGVGDGHGSVAIPKGGQRYAYLPSTIKGAYDAQATFGFPQLPAEGAGIRGGLTLKRLGDSYYLASVRVNPAGGAFLALHAVSGPFFSSKLTLDVPLGKIAAGGAITIKVRVGADAEGIMAAKAWPVGGTEPGQWQVSGNSSSVPAEGKVGVRFDAVSSSTGTTMWLDDLTAKQGTADPQPKPPTAAITLSQNSNVLKVDGSTSADPDGTITAFDWDYGDGSTATGVSPESHRYALPGTYTVTLKVTDSQGLSATATKQVTVADYDVPNAKNTGVPDGKELTTLTPSNIPYPDDAMGGSGGIKLVINTPGAIYDGWRFNHLVEVRAPGVTFRNCFFAGLEENPANSALLLIYDKNTADAVVPSAMVEDSTMIPRVPNVSIDGVRGSNFSLRRVEITKTVDGAHIYGPTQERDDPKAGNVLIERSWIHDLVYYETDPNHTNGSHNDGVQIRGGNNIYLLNNRIDGKIRNAAIQVTQAYNNVKNLVIVGNILANGLCTINIDDQKGTSGIPGVNISLNVFMRGTTYYKDCADIITDRTFAITTAAYDVWDDLGSPSPIAIDGRRSTGWRFIDGQPENATWPTDPDWNSQFGPGAPEPNSADSGAGDQISLGAELATDPPAAP